MNKYAKHQIKACLFLFNLCFCFIWAVLYPYLIARLLTKKLSPVYDINALLQSIVQSVVAEGTMDFATTEVIDPLPITFLKDERGIYCGGVFWLKC